MPDGTPRFSCKGLPLPPSLYLSLSTYTSPFLPGLLYMSHALLYLWAIVWCLQERSCTTSWAPQHSQSTLYCRRYQLQRSEVTAWLHQLISTHTQYHLSLFPSLHLPLFLSLSPAMQVNSSAALDKICLLGCGIPTGMSAMKNSIFLSPPPPPPLIKPNYLSIYTGYGAVLNTAKVEVRVLAHKHTHTHTNTHTHTLLEYANMLSTVLDVIRYQRVW